MPKCEMCGKDAELKEYKIVDDLGTRYRNICPECAEKLKSNQATFPSVNESAAGSSTVQPSVIKQKQKANIKPVYLYVLGVLFLVAAIIFYAVSVNNDYGVANIQTTVFAGANFVSAIVCFVGGAIIKALQE